MKKVLVILSLAVLVVGMTSCCRPCRKAKPQEIKGTRWGLMELNDKVIDRNAGERPDRLTLILGEEGRISGKGDCNGFFAAYSLTGDRISISNIGSTRMLCPDQPLENEYFQTLEKAVQIKIDGDFLLLMDKEGKIIVSFRKLNE